MVTRKGFYEDGHFDSKIDGEYVKYEDYLILEAQLRQRVEERNAFAKAIADAGDYMVDEATYADAMALAERLGL